MDSIHTSSGKAPLKGIVVLEFAHAVMGPACGLLLADMGADVIHIEPPEGDSTRRLRGFGTGYFSFYNRNKRSLALDIKSEQGKYIVEQLVQHADVLIENFGPGTMDRLGYGYEALAAKNPRVIYCSLKGFLSGPYERRHAMDEVVQMMGGLAYMTGPVGMPLRAGTSVVDITGGMFGVIGILAALYEREHTGKGQYIKSALFETTAFLMGQHMAYSAITQEPVPPMPARVSAWSVYRVFETRDNETVFIGIISEKHWERFCRAFAREDWLNDPRLATNNDRIAQRAWFLPAVEDMIRSMTKAEVIRRCEEAEIAFAPIARPEDLFDDVQLNQGGSLLTTTLPDGTVTKLPTLPLEMDYTRFGLRRNPPQIGEHTREILQECGLSDKFIAKLSEQGVIGGL
ncbi:MAG: CaiB/BaiF CoA-transferase family protein [Bacteroidota bacterium]|nr:CoA transferase [Candidatus Kapabacteria bacterium]MDW8219207.1 CaiB/BaiF CoA-transferase family protein [Bacteroidota bacterium]